MKKKIFVWALLMLNIILVIIYVNLKLKYEVEFFASEMFIHKNDDLESFEFQWPENKKMALSLTFDDARVSQVDNGLPILDKYCVNATFYVSLGPLGQRLELWRDAVLNGHEIGNHSTKHPCSINYDFSHENSLENYTINRMSNDLNNANEVIKKLFGLTAVSFAYPCGQTFVGEGLSSKSYVPLVGAMFESGRLYSGGAVNPVYCDMSRLPSVNLDNLSFDDLLPIIEDAKKKGKWLIFTGHDIGTENNGQTSLESTIDSICMYANDPSNGILIDNVHNIGSYIHEERGRKPFSYISNYRKTTGSLYGKIWSVLYIWKMKLVQFKHLHFSEK